MDRVRLGLIGDKIQASRAPELHRLAGEICGIQVTYDRLIPHEVGIDYAGILDRCEAEGYRGLNITYPYKEAVVPLIDPLPADLGALGACNTILFESGRRIGQNTDYSGFVAGFRHRFGSRAFPGRVAVAGAGGAGRAIAFGLAQLGAEEIRLVDTDAGRVAALADALATSGTRTSVRICQDMREAAAGADGLINATPLGMGGIGNAIPDDVLPGARWAFDAVYTPERTPFVAAAEAAGLEVMSGFELFLFQGVDAFRFFTGREVDPAALRAALRRGSMEEQHP